MTSDVLPNTTGVIRLRPKNQLTIPEPALTAIGVDVGDRFLVTMERGGIRLDPVRRSYAGSLSGVWGPEWADELRRERDAW